MNYGTRGSKGQEAISHEQNLAGKQQIFFLRTFCFDAQQAAEKALKGIIAFWDMDIPRTHSIGYLLTTIKNSGKVLIPDNIKDAVILTDYAVTTRYPEDWEPIDETEYNQAVALAREVFQWALSVISQDGEK